MMGDQKNRKLVVVQLSGGNDYLNCVVPYDNPRYIDNRPNVRLSEDQIIPFDNGYGLNPSMQPVKDLYDAGKVAVIQGCGYPEYSLSHEQSETIWETANPLKLGSLAGTGWVGTCGAGALRPQLAGGRGDRRARGALRGWAGAGRDGGAGPGGRGWAQ